MLDQQRVEAPGVLAHHTAGYIYDIEKPVQLNGIVTEVEWRQPHVIVHLDAQDDAGTLANWSVEMSGPLGGMYRRGVRPENFVKPGDAVRMTVCVAKDGSYTAAVHSITVPSTLQKQSRDVLTADRPIGTPRFANGNARIFQRGNR
jgi:hypothetical protein